MRKLSYLILPLAVLCSCMDMDNMNPYKEDLHTLKVQVSMPKKYKDYPLDSVTVNLKDNANGAVYQCLTDGNGVAQISLPNGVYLATLSATVNNLTFNGSEGGIVIDGGNSTCSAGLLQSNFGDIVIKEIYCGGCMRLPEQGTYQGDGYLTLHNNSDHTVYLDSLCFATLDPYNSQASSVWTKEQISEFAPVIQAIWQFPGTGTTYPLESGKDAVIAIYGAIDHSAQYPLSVNLNRPDCFVCYNVTQFWNTLYHPAPGDSIRQDHILNLVVKLGKANAYTFSNNSPAVIIFKSKGCTMTDFVGDTTNIIQKQGSDDRIVSLPNEWIIDGVEVFNGQQTNNKKRMGAGVDAGYVELSNTYQGKTLMRKVNKEKSDAAGYEVLYDTNNSSNDFYERQSQSLHDE